MLDPASDVIQPTLPDGALAGAAGEGASAEPEGGAEARVAAGAPGADAWREAAAVLEREAAAFGADPAAARLLHEAGRIHEERLGDVAGALARYRAAHDVDRLFAPNLEAARRAARACGDLGLECELLDAAARAATDPRDGADLALARSAALAALGDPDRAAAALRRAIEVDAASVAAAATEAAVAARGGDGGALSAAWERCAERAGGGALSAAWLLAASAVEEERPGGAERAAALAQRAFALDPGDASARAAARRLAPTAEALAAVLEADARAAT